MTKTNHHHHQQQPQQPPAAVAAAAVVLLCASSRYELKQKHYDPFCERIAAEMGGQYSPAPFKHTFRALEKTMLRHDPQERLHGDSVVDILRGCIQFTTLGGILACLRAIDADPAFKICRIKDRMSPGLETPAHWRDLMLNG